MYCIVPEIYGSEDAYLMCLFYAFNKSQKLNIECACSPMSKAHSIYRTAALLDEQEKMNKSQKINIETAAL